jgi:hypothetical protein
VGSRGDEEEQPYGLGGDGKMAARSHHVADWKSGEDLVKGKNGSGHATLTHRVVPGHLAREVTRWDQLPATQTPVATVALFVAPVHVAR